MRNCNFSALSKSEPVDADQEEAIRGHEMATTWTLITTAHTLDSFRKAVLLMLAGEESPEDIPAHTLAAGLYRGLAWMRDDCMDNQLSCIVLCEFIKVRRIILSLAVV